MKVSYEGIGQWAATFACADVTEGQVVQVSAGGTVAKCSAGDELCRRGAVCGPGQAKPAPCSLGGMVTVQLQRRHRARRWAGTAWRQTATAA